MDFGRNRSDLYIGSIVGEVRMKEDAGLWLGCCDCRST